MIPGQSPLGARPLGAGAAPYAEVPVGEVSQVRLAGVGAPFVDTGHRVHYRYGKTGDGAATFTIRLMLADATTEVAHRTHPGIPAGPTTASFALTEAEAATIPDADYTAGLVLQFEASS